MKFLKVLSSLILSSSLLFTAHAVQAEKLASFQKDAVLKIAVPKDFPPLGSVGIDLQPQGYDIDMEKYLAKQLNVKLKLVPL